MWNLIPCKCAFCCHLILTTLFPMVVQLKRVSLLVDDVAKGLPSLWKIPLLGMIGRNDKGRLREVVPRRRIPRLGRSLIILWRPRRAILESLVVVEIY